MAQHRAGAVVHEPQAGLKGAEKEALVGHGLGLSL